MNTVTVKGVRGKAPKPMAERRMEALRVYTALAAMCNGTARREEWQDCADCVNMVEALAAMGKYNSTEVTPLVTAAIAGLMVAIKCPDGMMRMGAAATLALRTLVTMYDEALGDFSQATMHTAWRLAVRQIDAPTASESGGISMVDA